MFYFVFFSKSVSGCPIVAMAKLKNNMKKHQNGGGLMSSDKIASGSKKSSSKFILALIKLGN